MNFLWKKRSQILPPEAYQGRKKKVAWLQSQRFLDKIQNGGQMVDSHSTDLSVSGEERHSTILLVHYMFAFIEDKVI